MSARVAGIGVGLFILAFIWVVALFLCVALSKAQGSIANLGIGSVLLAIVLTVVLWFIPRDDTTSEIDYAIYDYYGLGRTILVSFMGIFLIFGLLIFVVFHIFEPQRAEPLKKIST